MIISVCASCKSDKEDIVNARESTIILHEGITRSIQIDQNTLSVTLKSITPIYMEGLVQDKVYMVFRSYDAKIDVNGEEVVFRTMMTTHDDVRQKLSWEQLVKTYQGIKPYKTFQIGISDIYTEGNPDSGGFYIASLLIR